MCSVSSGTLNLNSINQLVSSMLTWSHDVTPASKMTVTITLLISWSDFSNQQPVVFWWCYHLIKTCVMNNDCCWFMSLAGVHLHYQLLYRLAIIGFCCGRLAVLTESSVHGCGPVLAWFVLGCMSYKVIKPEFSLCFLCYNILCFINTFLPAGHYANMGISYLYLCLAVSVTSHTGFSYNLFYSDFKEIRKLVSSKISKLCPKLWI